MRYSLSIENESELILAVLFNPRLSSCSFVPLLALKTLITVPFSEPVATCENEIFNYFGLTGGITYGSSVL